MYWNGATTTNATGCSSEGLDILDAMHREREAVTERIFFFATKATNKDQNAAAHSGLAQRDTFIGRSDTEPRGTLLFERQSRSFGAVTVGVALNDRADSNGSPDVLLNRTKVVAQ